VLSFDLLKRLCRRLLGILLWSATGIILLSSFFVVRLIYAPISLDFARDAIVEQTAEFLPGWEVSFDAAEIGWDYSGVRPWVHIRDVTLVDRRQRLTAQLESARIVVTPGSLISGLSISAIDIEKARVDISDLGAFSDSTDNSMFSDLFANGGMPRPEVFRPITEAFSRFSERLLRKAPGLNTIKFSNSHFEVARGPGLAPLAFGVQKLRLTHLEDILQVSAQVDASIADLPTSFRLAGSAEPTAGILAVTLSFNDLSPSALAQKMDLPKFFNYFKLPVGLDLRLEMTSLQGLEKAAFDVAIGQGVLSDAIAYPGGSEISYGLVSANYNVAEELLTIDGLKVGLGSNLIQGSGLVFWDDRSHNPGFRLDLIAARATIEDVKKYWPVKVNPDGSARGARAWIDQNMIAGIAKNLRFTINQAPDGSTPYAEGSAYELLFDFEDIDSLYLKGMPPMMGVTGNAVLTKTALDVFIKSGTIEGMAVAGSKVSLHDIHKRGKAVGEFNVALNGPLYDVMTLLAHPPVRINKMVKIDLDRFGGNADISAKITMPLIKNVAKSLVSYDVTAKIADGSLKYLMGGSGLSKAGLLLTLNKDLLTASGQGKLNGVPLDLHWREDFKAGRTDPDAETTNLVLGGIIDEKGLAALGVDIAEYLAGPVHSEATFLGRNLKINKGYFSADASNAKLMVPQLAWQKGATSPANINGSVFFEDGTSRLEALTVTGEGIDLEADIKWGEKGSGIFEGQFRVNQLGRNKMLASIVGTKRGNVNVVVAADRFDLGPLMARRDTVLDQVLANPDANAPANKPSSEINLSLDADEFLLLNGESLRSVKADVHFSDNEPGRLNISGQDKNGLTTFVIEEGNDRLLPLRIGSQDAGGLLRGLGFFAHIGDGELLLDGETSGWGQSLEVLGTLHISDANLVSKNSLGLQVEQGIVGGLDTYLEDGPLVLDVVDMPFSFQDNLLDISSMKANGPSLGMTMEGQIETQQGKINVNGVVVPAYGLNSLLGKIPLLGGLFSGGEGKGLFGVSYRIKGSTAAPDVSVNKLSGLAPGFLRLLFEGRKGTVDGIEDVPAPEEATPEVPIVNPLDPLAGQPAEPLPEPQGLAPVPTDQQSEADEVKPT